MLVRNSAAGNICTVVLVVAALATFFALVGCDLAQDVVVENTTADTDTDTAGPDDMQTPFAHYVVEEGVYVCRDSADLGLLIKRPEGSSNEFGTSVAVHVDL